AYVEPLETTIYEIECYNDQQPTPGVDSETVIVDPARGVLDCMDDPEGGECVPLSWGEAIEMRADRIALLGSYQDGLRIVDVSNPAVPSEIGSWDPVTCINDTPFGDETVDFVIEEVALDATDEDIVYVSAGPCGLFTVDLDFQGGVPNPVVLSIIDTDGWTEHVEMEGDTAYIADYNGGVLSFDMGDRSNPSPLGMVAYDDASFGAALEIDVEDDLAYVASSRGLRVVDISNPRDLRVVSSVDTDVDNGFVPQGIRIWNGFAFLSSWTGGLLVMDVRGAPVLLPDRRVETDYAFYKLAIQELEADVDGTPQALLYIAEGLSGIQVVDISRVDPNSRYVTLEQIDIGKFVWDIGLYENDESEIRPFVSFGELTNYDGGLQMIIDRPTVPVPPRAP
ncbi:MAG: hypothetical protein QF570_16630, partial [Myxococcota bacterium]|nr:hypothetical protein [Myxococcota bacterium]